MQHLTLPDLSVQVIAGWMKCSEKMVVQKSFIILERCVVIL